MNNQHLDLRGTHPVMKSFSEFEQVSKDMQFENEKGGDGDD